MLRDIFLPNFDASMKKFLHKIMSISMAFVVLFSTMSYTLDMHYCGDILVDTAIFHKAETCGMEMEQPSPVKDCSVKKKNCCNDQQLVVDGQDELQLAFDKLSIDEQLFVTTFAYTYISLFEGIEENLSSYRYYEPPPVIKPIYKLDETYLI